MKSVLFDLLHAEIIEDQISFGLNKFINRFGNADSIWLRQSLEPCGNINPITIQIAVFNDDVTHIYADAKLHDFSVG